MGDSLSSSRLSVLGGWQWRAWMEASDGHLSRHEACYNTAVHKQPTGPASPPRSGQFTVENEAGEQADAQWRKALMPYRATCPRVDLDL